MSSEPQPPDDRELEAFLDGEHPLAKAYADARREPPAHLDATVLQLARAAALPPARRRLRRWRTPLAAAAVLVLAVGVSLRLPERALPPAVVSSDSREGRNGRLAESEITSAQRAEAPAAPSVAPPPARKPAPPPAPMPSAAPPPAAMAPAPVQAYADAAGGAASVEESPAQDEVRAARVERRAFAMAESASRAARKQQLATPMFDGLPVGVATREQVRARYGEPSAVTESAALTPGGAAAFSEHYPHLPGHPGRFEFSYASDTSRLLVVREILPPDTAASGLMAALGWKAPAQISDRVPLGCTATAPLSSGARYFLFPERSALFAVDGNGQVLQLIIAAGCADSD